MSTRVKIIPLASHKEAEEHEKIVNDACAAIEAAKGQILTVRVPTENPKSDAVIVYRIA